MTFWRHEQTVDSFISNNIRIWFPYSWKHVTHWQHSIAKTLSDFIIVFYIVIWWRHIMALESHVGAREITCLSKNKLLFIILECSRYSGTLGYIPKFTVLMQTQTDIIGKLWQTGEKNKCKTFFQNTYWQTVHFKGKVGRSDCSMSRVTWIREHKSF